MLVAAVNAALAVIVVGPRDRRRYRPAAAMAVVLLGIAWWGSARLTRNELTQTGEQIRVGLIQGNIDQAIKWDPGHASSIFGDHLRLTRHALQSGAEFVMWPESSMPFFFEEDRRRHRAACGRWRVMPACRFCSAAINFCGARTTAAA